MAFLVFFLAYMLPILVVWTVICFFVDEQITKLLKRLEAWHLDRIRRR